MPESEADILLHDLDNKRAPKGLPRRRGRGKPTVSTGGAYLARRTLALLRDSFDRDEARQAWESELNIFTGTPEPGTDDEGFRSWYFNSATKRRYFWFGGLLALVRGV